MCSAEPAPPAGDPAVRRPMNSAGTRWPSYLWVGRVPGFKYPCLLMKTCCTGEVAVFGRFRGENLPPPSRRRSAGPSRYIEWRAVSVAQLVELLVVVQVVAGSSPVAHPE